MNVAGAKEILNKNIEFRKHCVVQINKELTGEIVNNHSNKYQKEQHVANHQQMIEALETILKEKENA